MIPNYRKSPHFYTLNRLPINFEVSNSTPYEDMKGNTKYRKLGGLG